MSPRRYDRRIVKGAHDGGDPQNSIATEPAFKSRPRAISTGALNALLRLHVPPIKVVVSDRPYSLEGMGELILRSASRLDAFSGYPVRT